MIESVYARIPSIPRQDSENGTWPGTHTEEVGALGENPKAWFRPHSWGAPASHSLSLPQFTHLKNAGVGPYRGSSMEMS